MIRCLWLRFRFCPGFWFRAYAASGNSLWSIPGRPWGSFWISNRGSRCEANSLRVFSSSSGDQVDAFGATWGAKCGHRRWRWVSSVTSQRKRRFLWESLTCRHRNVHEPTSAMSGSMASGSTRTQFCHGSLFALKYRSRCHVSDIREVLLQSYILVLTC